MQSLFKPLIKFLVIRSKAIYQPYEIFAAVLFGSTLELGVIPYALIRLGKEVDQLLAFGNLFPPRLSIVLSVCCFLIGVPWLASSIYIQHRKGQGTPLPLVPTKRLIVEGPYRYTRNPMALGAIFWLGGWAFIANSPVAFFGGVGAFALILFSYHKLVEEKELEERFGSDFLEYKKHTPFLIPRFYKVLSPHE